MKKTFLIFTLIAVMITSVFAADYLQKRTSLATGYEGYSICEYIGNKFDFGMDYATARQFAEDLMDAEYGEENEIVRLSKNQKYLIDAALNDWEILEGDIYLVEWMETTSNTHYITLVVYDSVETRFMKTYVLQ